MKISNEDECGGSQRQVGPMVSSTTPEILVKIGLLFSSSVQLLVSTFIDLTAA